MARNILFLVTGMTPQIITETVWALACDPNNPEPWIPDEIHVLSTDDGLTQIRSRLFSEKEGRKFAQFQQDYPLLASIVFENDPHFLQIITDKVGNILKDLKTPADNERAANMICQKIREFTEQDDVNLHVSIAGGRKTMGFYAGYALSLYGRSQDRMSHVLVEEKYESARDFFYPTPQDNVYITNKDGIELKAKDAKIWLATIPFVRMRSYISSRSLVAEASFSDVVEAINLAYQPINVIINELDKTVWVNDKPCKLSPREFAFYLWLAKRKKAGLVGVRRPIENVPYEDAEGYQEIYNGLGKSKKVMFDQDFFDQRNTFLKRDLEKVFGIDVASKIGVGQKANNQEYECALTPENIIIHEM